MNIYIWYGVCIPVLIFVSVYHSLVAVYLITILYLIVKNSIDLDPLVCRSRIDLLC